jgi:SAM-dependent methyltransferase
MPFLVSRSKPPFRRLATFSPPSLRASGGSDTKDRFPGGAYAARVTDRHAAAWEALARREPYFAVLGSDGTLKVDGNRGATEAFFRTGEDDLALLLSTIGSLLGREPRLTDALDFGCGVGRLTLPLARRAIRVVGCDIAPTMLGHARQNAEDAGLHNITFTDNSQLDALPDGKFDLVLSLLVLQYIPPTAGYPIIRTLLRLLAPAGVAALHLPFAPRGGGLRRLARLTPRRPRMTPGVAMGVPSSTDAPAVYQYDELTVRRDLAAADAAALGRFTARIADRDGTVLVAQKR